MVPIVIWAAYTVVKTRLTWAVADLLPGLDISLKSSDNRFTLITCAHHPPRSRRRRQHKLGVRRTFSAKKVD